MIYEIKRKALHLIAVLFPFALLYFEKYGYSPYVSLAYLVILSLINVAVDKLRGKNNIVNQIYSFFFGDILREHEKQGKFTGATNFFISLTISYFIFYILLKINLKFIIIAYTGFMLGDAAAALVGKAFGHIKIFNKKTLEGSAACFLVAFISTFWIYNQDLIPLKIAFLTSLFELISLKIDDNFFVPISTLLFITVIT